MRRGLRWQVRSSRLGFTLIELAGVLVLSAMLAGATALSVAGSRQRIEFDDAVQQIQHADAQLRDAASRSALSVSLSIDLGESVLRRQETDDNARSDRTVIGELPGRIKVQEVRLGAERVQFGEATIPFSRAGSAPTYAVLLVGAHRHQWIAMVGLSGQPVKVSDDEVEAIFDSITAVGTHAD